MPPSLPPTSLGDLSEVRFGWLGRHPLFLGALACVLPALLFFVSLKIDDRRKTLNTAAARIENVAAPLAANVDIILESLDRGLIAARESVIEDIARGDDNPEAVFRALRTARKHTALPVNYAMVTSAGTLYATSRFLLKDPVDVSDRHYYRVHTAATADSLHVGHAVRSRIATAGTGAIVPVSRGVWSDTGAFMGVIVATLDSAYLARTFAGLSISDTVFVILQAGDGRAISVISSPDALDAEAMPDLPGLDDPAGEEAPWWDADDLLTTRAEVPGESAYILAGMSRADALARWHRRVSGTGGLLGVFALIVMTGAFAADRSRTRRERFRREAQVMLNVAFASMDAAVVVTDPDGRVVLYNATAAGLAREQTTSQMLFDRFPWISQTGCEDLFVTAKETGQPVRHEVKLLSDDRWLAMLIHPFNGGMLLYVRDVTHAKHLSEQLTRAQKMEAVGQLTGGVAHDFNNLLTVILGNAELLSEELEHMPAQHELAAMIVQAGERGADLTRHLLAFSRRQALTVETTDLGDLVARIRGLLERALGGHIDVKIAAAPDIWQAIVDPSQFESALLNLAINARDAMPDGGRLTIELGKVHLDETYAGWNDEVTPGDYVLVAVSDTGSGMLPEVAARAFDPFFTTKAVGKGTGLGLSMVYGFIKQSKGHVKIYSELGQGTTVKLYLPRALGRGVEAVAPPPGAAFAGGSERILLVEDDPLVRAHAAAQLGSLGYAVVTAEDGPKALSLIVGGEVFDLLFTDVVMPGGMSGRRLADEAQKIIPALPVLYTSGYTENAIVHHGHLDTGVDLLNKPYRQADLARKVREVLDKRVHFS